MQLSVRKLLLLSLNLVSTLLTLFSGLRENPIIVFVTGRYDLVRTRMIEGAINYDIVRDDLLKIDKLTNLTAVGERYRFISAPTRSPDNLAEDRSTCVRVNSMNATMMTTNYDDFWGKGPRRTQIFLYSISAPHCKIVNFRPDWYEKDCVVEHSNNALACHRYILDNFEDLQDNRVIQVGVERDFGEPGVPFLKCLGRPERTFQYMTDLMVHQSFWAGGSYHVELQSSKCLAVPLIRNSDWKWGLFKVEPADHAATVVAAIDNSGWVTELVGVLYGIVSISMIVQGIFAAIVQSTAVYYVPDKLRFLKEKKYLKYFFPCMAIATTFPEDDNTVIRFKGALFMASDVWMNHWLYITLSILDSLLNLRMMYMVLEMGTWMLGKKVNLENFIFMCGALTKITWIMCALHSFIRMVLKVVIRGMKSLKIVRPSIREKMEWYVDAYSLFLSYKVYSIMLCFMLFLFLQLHGGTTFMRYANPSKSGVFGGMSSISQFWGNEIICDLTVILSILALAGFLGGSFMLKTKYKHVVNNSVVKLLQRRYVLVGWDVFVAMEALGIDIANPNLLVNDVITTNCSFGAVIQQLYTSGPSGRVHLAGDYLFEEGGMARDPVKFHYCIKKATEMGLCKHRSSSHTSTKYTVTTTNDERHHTAKELKDETNDLIAQALKPKNTTSLFDRRLQLFSESRFGRVLLVDESEPGKLAKNATGSLMEFVVQDALSFLSILDIKPLLGNEKKLRIS
uniref:Uncharacterized protein n=1 Tax=Globisporangium ultimum (strain ATCC 200006 / CBS 805.95 / DAOM BR144) TaxID=431595 RepID=K3WZ47_GLOUD